MLRPRVQRLQGDCPSDCIALRDSRGLRSSLETVKHNCQIVYKSPHDGNIANFDDATWLNAFYNIDGKKIVALGHMEYHGWEHPGMCASKTDTAACWYNVDTYYLSEDGGYHFTRPEPPANYFLGLPYKYQVNQGPEGYSVDANIVKVGEWYYDEVYSWAWPPNCGAGKGQKPCLVPDGSCAIRTANILDASSWRGAGRMEVAALCGNSPPWRSQPIAPDRTKGPEQKRKNSL
jgi:hypothetical protein